MKPVPELDADRWRCQACGHIMGRYEMLEAPNPFDHDYVIAGCPKCREVIDNASERLCDVKGCKRTSSCGTPTSDGGYIRCCGTHFDQYGARTSQKEHGPNAEY